MALTEMAFIPATGLLDTSTFPTDPANETAARTQFQTLYDQLRDYLNDTLLAELAAVTDGAAGADNIGMTAITETGAAATVQAVVEALITKLKAVTDGAAGADLVGMTAITETGAAATVQAVIEALITKLKDTTDSASGADLVGATAISGLTGTTVQALLESLDSDKVDKSVVTAAGDLIVGSGSGAVARKALGSANQVLAVNAGGTDLEYQTGLMTEIADTVLGSAAASISVSSIASGFSNILVYLELKATEFASTSVNLTLNDDTTESHYGWQSVIGTGNAASASWTSADTKILLGNYTGATYSYISHFQLAIANRSGYIHGLTGTGYSPHDSASYNATFAIGGLWRGTNEINKITVTAGAGNFAAGSRMRIIGLA